MRMTKRTKADARVGRWSGSGVVLLAALAGGCGTTVINGIERGDAGVVGGRGGSGGGWIGSGGAGPCTPAQPPDASARQGADRQVRDMDGNEARAWCEDYITHRYGLGGSTAIG